MWSAACPERCADGCVAGTCLADEGFFVDNKPAAVRAIWPSVFALVCESRKGVYIASAFLVGKTASKRRKNRADYYFMTVGHAIDDAKVRGATLPQTSTSRTSRPTASRWRGARCGSTA